MAIVDFGDGPGIEWGDGPGIEWGADGDEGTPEVNWAPGNYLNAATADYTTEALSVIPHEVLIYTSKREQMTIPYDDGTETRIDMDDDHVFFVGVKWKNLTYENATTVLSFALALTKGNGITQTFEWSHPTDSYTYVVRLTSLPRFYQNPPDLWDVDAQFKLIGTA